MHNNNNNKCNLRSNINYNRISNNSRASHHSSSSSHD